MTEGKRNNIHQLLEEYDIQTTEDIQGALKDLPGGTIREMMEAEMDEHNILVMENQNALTAMTIETVTCADGLTGIKETIAAAFPKTKYQRCIVHQVRNTLKYVPDKDRKTFAADLKTIYQAADEKKALDAPERVTEKGAPKYPNAMKRWKNNWDAYHRVVKNLSYLQNMINTYNF